jgi:hypothetical protein
MTSSDDWLIDLFAGEMRGLLRPDEPGAEWFAAAGS